MELYSCLKLLANRLAILSDPVTLSTTGDGVALLLPKCRCTSDQKPRLGSLSNDSANFVRLI